MYIIDDRGYITVPDGYACRTVLLDARVPLAEDGDLVKLRVVGSTHLIRWVRTADIIREAS